MDVQPAPAPGSDIIVSGTGGPELTDPAPPATIGAAQSAVADAADGHHGAAIAGAIAKLYAPSADVAQAEELSVSYRVLRDHEIVTVFTDPKTGAEITQVPSEALIGLAEFFDQQQGATFDRTA